MKLLLTKLECQRTDGLFSYSAVIADNDSGQSAKDMVSFFSAASAMEIVYCVEPEQNIALARNMALKNSRGNFIAFIDDDEFPDSDWLYCLFKTCRDRDVDGVLGPVLPFFEHSPPPWILKGKFFERPAHTTGYKMSGPESRTGNVLFRKEIISRIDQPFRAEFGTGSEDVDFFRRMANDGKTFVWCQEAVVHELVSPQRCRRSYQVKYALLRGGNSLKHRQKHKAFKTLKSLAAVILYGTALPFLFMGGDHLFMNYFIKLCDHAGRVLKFIGLNPVKRRGL